MAAVDTGGGRTRIGRKGAVPILQLSPRHKSWRTAEFDTPPTRLRVHLIQKLPQLNTIRVVLFVSGCLRENTHRHPPPRPIPGVDARPAHVGRAGSSLAQNADMTAARTLGMCKRIFFPEMALRFVNSSPDDESSESESESESCGFRAAAAASGAAGSELRSDFRCLFDFFDFFFFRSFLL